MHSLYARSNLSPAGAPNSPLFTHSTGWKSVILRIRCTETNVITAAGQFLAPLFSRLQYIQQQETQKERSDLDLFGQGLFSKLGGTIKNILGSIFDRHEQLCRFSELIKSAQSCI